MNHKTTLKRIGFLSLFTRTCSGLWKKKSIALTSGTWQSKAFYSPPFIFAVLKAHWRLLSFFILAFILQSPSTIAYGQNKIICPNLLASAAADSFDITESYDLWKPYSDLLLSPKLGRFLTEAFPQ